jgi:hypothetical protein
MTQPQPGDGYILNPNVPEGTEDLGNGLYIHPDVPVMTMSRDGKPEVYVSASAFMEMQKKRDEYRRVLALINAWRVDPNRSERGLRQLLERVGEGDTQAEATLDIMRWVQSEQLARRVKGEA